MNTEQKERIVEAFNNADFEEVVSILNDINASNGELKTVNAFCQLLLQEFKHAKDKYFALAFDRIIKANPKYASVGFPKNPIFQFAVMKGAMEIYEAYIECYILNQDKEKQEELFMDLSMQAEEWKEPLESNYTKVIKGREYNGAFTLDENPGQAIMNLEDYQIMDHIVENYNAIVGRWEILKDLSERF